MTVSVGDEFAGGYVSKVVSTPSGTELTVVLPEDIEPEPVVTEEAPAIDEPEPDDEPEDDEPEEWVV
jgi:hypothetical protein